MADDANDVQSTDITPEDFLGEQNAPEAESSPAKEEAKAEPENKTEEAKAEPEKSEEAKPEAEKEGDDKDAEKPAEEEKPTKGAEERKQQLQKDIDEGKKELGIDPNTEIRDMVAARNAIRDAVKAKNAETYQVADVKDLTDEINPDTGEKYTPVEAKVEAMRQQNELEQYNNQVADAQLQIQTESARVLQEFPVFNKDSDQFDEELATEAAELLYANLIFDENTNELIGSNISPYQLYKTLARATTISGTKERVKGQQSAEQQLANADPASAAAPEKKKSDPLTDLWKDEL